METRKALFIVVIAPALTGLADGLGQAPLATLRWPFAPGTYGSPVYLCYAGKFSYRTRGTVAAARSFATDPAPGRNSGSWGLKEARNTIHAWPRPEPRS